MWKSGLNRSTCLAVFATCWVMSAPASAQFVHRYRIEGQNTAFTTVQFDLITGSAANCGTYVAFPGNTCSAGVFAFPGADGAGIAASLANGINFFCSSVNYSASANGNPVLAEGPERVHQSVVQLFLPFALEESLDLVAPLHELDRVHRAAAPTLSRSYTENPRVKERIGR